MKTSILAIFGVVVVVVGIFSFKSLSKPPALNPGVIAGPPNEGGVSSNRAILSAEASVQSADPLPVIDGLDEAALIKRARELAATDSEVAMDWAQKITDDRMRHQLLTTIGREIASRDAKQAIRLATSFPDGEPRRTYVENITHVWATYAPGDAAEWATGITDPLLQGVVQNVIATEWAQKNPGAAADYVATGMTIGNAQDQAALTVALRWAHLDLPAATAWARSFPAGALKESILRAVASVARQ